MERETIILVTAPPQSWHYYPEVVMDRERIEEDPNEMSDNSTLSARSATVFGDLRWVLYSWQCSDAHVPGSKRTAIPKKVYLSPAQRLEAGFLAAICQRVSYVSLFGSSSSADWCKRVNGWVQALKRTIRDRWSRVRLSAIAEFSCLAVTTLRLGPSSI